jgi:predicted alpha/beta-hydrolase family hydrolase
MVSIGMSSVLHKCAGAMFYGGGKCVAMKTFNTSTGLSFALRCTPREALMPGHVILSHGSDASPDATKVSVLAKIAESMGWTAERPDYRPDDALGHAGSVAPRIARLHERIAASRVPPVLVGSSMGAFVSGLASLEQPVAGLFLVATPPLIPGSDLAFDVREEVPTLLVHGWRDDICPLDEVYEFARRRSLPLLVLDDDHRLGAHVDELGRQFGFFLEQWAKHA